MVGTLKVTGELNKVLGEASQRESVTISYEDKDCVQHKDWRCCCLGMYPPSSL